MSEEIETNKVETPPRSRARNLVLLLAGMVILLALAIFFLRPYARLERIARVAISHHAPPGTAVGDVRVGFPLNITLSNLTIPVRVDGRRRELQMEELAGRISVLPLLLGKMKVDMSADIFDGKLWLDLSGESASKGALAIDARTRRVDIGKLREFLGSRLKVSGNFDADVETELNAKELTTLKGNATAMSRDVSIPRIDLGKVVLPENSRAECTIGLSAEGGKIHINKFLVKGTAYDISGKGTINISDPFEYSPLDGSFSTVFRQPPTITDKRLAGLNTKYLMGALVESESEVFFKISGTVGNPEASLDPSASIGSILKGSKR
jgi:type II secretion system protein N